MHDTSDVEENELEIGTSPSDEVQLESKTDIPPCVSPPRLEQSSSCYTIGYADIDGFSKNQCLTCDWRENFLDGDLRYAFCEICNPQDLIRNGTNWYIT